MADTPIAATGNPAMRALAVAGLFLGYLFLAMSAFASAVRQNGGEAAPVLAAFVGILLFRRLTRKRSEFLLLGNPSISAVPHYLRSFASAGLRWLGLFAVIAILAAFSMEVAEEKGAAVGRVVGVMVFTMLFAWDIPYRVFRRYCNDPSAAPKAGELPWAIFGAVAVVLAVVLGLVFGVPAVRNALTMGENVKESIQSRNGGDSAQQVDTRRVVGDFSKYSFDLPQGWDALKNQSVFDLALKKGPLSVGVIAEEEQAVDTAEVASHALEELRRKAQIIEETEPQRFYLDGKEWLQFMTLFNLRDKEFVSIYYVYSGPEGAFQVVGSTSTHPYKEGVKEMSRIMKTFQFP